RWVWPKPYVELYIFETAMEKLAHQCYVFGKANLEVMGFLVPRNNGNQRTAGQPSLCRTLALLSRTRPASKRRLPGPGWRPVPVRAD
ncbi:MAG: hypothetical protein ABIK86_00840, partial [candidate division WOR-3 bacterium]